MKYDYDVIVVGAGPAGSIAAKTTAEAGLKTILFEKRQEIGTPVRCAEATGTRQEIGKFIPIDDSWINADIAAGRFISPSGYEMYKNAGHVGIMLERKIFDRALAEQASDFGSEIQCRSAIVGLTENGVKVSSFGKEYEITGRYIVASDGVESQVARFAGINNTIKLKDIHSCIQYLVKDIDIDEECIDIYVGNKVSPGGYVWVFPKGKRMANVGLGICSDKNKNAKAYLDEFMQKHFPKGKIVGMVLGAVPGGSYVKELVKDNILFVGDAARQVNPLTGGGIFFALEAGRISGEVIGEAHRKDDDSILQNYQTIWDKKYSKLFTRYYKMRKLFLSMNDEEFDFLVQETNKIATKYDGGKTNFNKQIPEILWKAFTKNPKFMLKAGLSMLK